MTKNKTRGEPRGWLILHDYLSFFPSGVNTKMLHEDLRGKLVYIGGTLQWAHENNLVDYTDYGTDRFTISLPIRDKL